MYEVDMMVKIKR